MKVEIEDIKFWMDAVRNSEDRDRTLESFWGGQLKSKESQDYLNKIKVIIDQVLSHSSDIHPFFKTSKSNKNNSKSDWYVWADPKPDGSPPNNWLSVFGGSAWEWDTSREQYYLHNFLKSQPEELGYNL